MAQRRKRPPAEGALVRKLDPKLRMIRNGGKTVNQIRSERCAAIAVRKLEPSLARLREPDDAPAPSDLVKHLPRKAWEMPERGSEDVIAGLFLTLSDARAGRGKALWKDARITRTRDNLVTVEAPLASLPRIA